MHGCTTTFSTFRKSNGRDPQFRLPHTQRTQKKAPQSIASFPTAVSRSEMYFGAQYASL